MKKFEIVGNKAVNKAHGIWSLKETKKAIKSKRSGYRAEKKRAIAKTVIEIFERITMG